jgi:glyoxylase-like metal-dependent hydrolase (beta-lactamase superfamily II)/rhodanese-related sulfurtransferase
MTLDVLALVDEGLGNTTYLVDLGDGRALVVDPSRDLRGVHEAAAGQGLQVAYAADTHLHADFLSGARQLGRDAGATILASAEGDRQFHHRGLRDGEEVDLGGLTLRALSTPGHTQEHLAFVLLDGDKPCGVFTGGSLIVGAAARTDLVSPDQTETLARAQYHSLQRLMSLPDATPVWPTHGAGSFCAAPPGAERTSTIGRERRTNPLLAAEGEEAFVAALLGPLGSYPAYFDRLGEINRQGPPFLDGAPALRPLDVERVAALLEQGAELVDVRPVERYAERHVPGSLSVPLREQFATWLGSLVDLGVAVVIVRDPDQDPLEVAWQAAKIGYDPAGELKGGLAAWEQSGRAVATTRLVTPGQLPQTAGAVLDIRQKVEFAAGHLPGAQHLELGALRPSREAASEPPGGGEPRLDAVQVVMCGHGERAMSAASLLERQGLTDVAVLVGGPDDWSTATGQPLQADL